MVFGALALLFGALLDPGRDAESCTTGLRPGAYADAIVPAHLVAFAALAALVAWLSAQRSPRGRPGRVTLAALAAAALFALAATVDHSLMGWPALAALVFAFPIGALAAAAALTNVLLVLRSRRGPADAWARHAAAAHAAAWLAIVVGLPAALAGAWTNGAGLFCF